MKALRLGTDRFLCLAPGESPYVEFSDRHAAVSFLKQFQSYPTGMASLRSLLQEVDISVLASTISRVTDERVIERLSELLVTNRLRLFKLSLHTPAPGGGGPAEEQPQPAPVELTAQEVLPSPAVSQEVTEPAPEETDEETTWVAIEVVDQEGNPAKDVRYSITLPDGSVETGSTDANGQARYSGIEPGTCDITFPDLADEDWEYVSGS